jgi:hypothetical protein
VSRGHTSLRAYTLLCNEAGRQCRYSPGLNIKDQIRVFMPARASCARNTPINVQTPLASSGSACEPSLRLRKPASMSTAYFIRCRSAGRGEPTYIGPAEQRALIRFVRLGKSHLSPSYRVTRGYERPFILTYSAVSDKTPSARTSTNAVQFDVAYSKLFYDVNSVVCHGTRFPTVLGRVCAAGIYFAEFRRARSAAR